MFLGLKVLLIIEVLQLGAAVLFLSTLKPSTRKLITPVDIAILLSIPVVGLFGQDKLIFYFFLFFIPFLSIGDAAAMVRRYLLTLLMIPELSELHVFGQFYVGALSTIVFLNAGLLAAYLLTSGRARRQIPSIDLAAWTVFVIAIFFVARGETIGSISRFATITFFIVMPPYLVISRALRSSEAVGGTVLFFIFGGFLNAAIAIFEGLRRWPLYETMHQMLYVERVGLSASLSLRAGFLRASGAVFNYETLGLVTGLASIAAVALRHRCTPTGRVVLPMVLGLGCLASQARSAWIATLIGFAVYGIYKGRGLKVLGAGAALAIPILLAITASPSTSRLGQMLGKSGHGQESAEYRSRLFDRGIEETLTHPVFGQTLKQLQVSMNDLRQGEQIIDYVNTHLLVALVGGFGLLAVWFVAWTIPLRAGWSRRRAVHAPDVAIAVPFAMMAACFVALSFTSPVDRMLPLTTISMALISVCIRFARSPAGSSERIARTGGVRLAGAHALLPSRRVLD